MGNQFHFVCINLTKHWLNFKLNLSFKIKNFTKHIQVLHKCYYFGDTQQHYEFYVYIDP